MVRSEYVYVKNVIDVQSVCFHVKHVKHVHVLRDWFSLLRISDSMVD
jgi:hypothetical protein